MVSMVETLQNAYSPKQENRKYVFKRKYLRVKILIGMNTDFVIHAAINIAKTDPKFVEKSEHTFVTCIRKV